jgi:hypothetical protein
MQHAKQDSNAARAGGMRKPVRLLQRTTSESEELDRQARTRAKGRPMAQRQADDAKPAQGQSRRTRFLGPLVRAVSGFHARVEQGA